MDGPIAGQPRSALGASRTGSIQAVARTIDPVRFVGASWWLALVAIAVLQGAHDGLHEHLELPPLLHLVRDAALAVPAAALALVAGAFAIARLPGASGRGSIRARIAWVCVVGCAFAVLSIPGNQLHGTLFGAEAEEGLSVLTDLALDAVIALVGALLALIPFALAVGLPVAATDPSDLESSPRLRPGLTVAERSSK